MRDLLRGAIRLHVLHHAAEGDVHGGWMARELARHGYRVSPGTLYPRLHAMEREGLLVSSQEVVSGHARRVYRATLQGRDVLSEARETLSELADEILGDRLGTALAEGPYPLRPIGWVESPLADRSLAPKRGDEGSPDAWLVFESAVSEGLRDLERGIDVIVLTWLDRARRDVLRVHPRGDPASPEQGVFSTRSPDRPNPIGLHRVEVISIEGTRIRVRNLEALDRTPIVDVKPVLDRGLER